MKTAKGGAGKDSVSTISMALYSKRLVRNELSKKDLWREAKRTQSMCHKKQAYSKKKAQTVKNHRMNCGSPELRIYQCPLCNNWHLTSQIINKYE